MPRIHPTAVIDPRAQIAADAAVGPFCLIEGPVTIGPGCELQSHVVLRGPLTLGSHNRFFPFSCIGTEPQDRKFNGKTAGILIGDGNTFREGVSIHQATSLDTPTRIGDHNYLMSNAHIGHDCRVADHCTLASGALLGGHVELQDQVNLGGNAAVHQFSRLGRLSFLGGVSGAAKDVPPFSIASGLVNVVGINLVGLRRSGVSHEAIDEVRKAFETLYLSGHTNPVAADLIDRAADQNGPGAPLLREFAAFIRQSRRGLTPHSIVNLRHRIRR